MRPDENGHDQHLSDERLSAYVDGEVDQPRPGEPDLDRHIEACDSCLARLASLRAVRALVASPVTIEPQDRSHTVASALAAWDARPTRAAEALTDQSQQASDDESRAQRLVPVGARRWYRSPRVLGAAAAVLVVVALAITLPLAFSRPSSTQSNSAASSAAPPQAPLHSAARLPSGSGNSASGNSASGNSASGNSASGNSSPPSVLPDLGGLDSTGQLVSRLQDLRSSAGPSGQAPSAGASSQAPGASAAQTPTQAASVPGSCVESARAASGGGDYGPGAVATAVYKGHEAFVMEFWPTAAGATSGETVVAVVTQNGCSLITRTTF
jgi:negative regulator of sigma E activity